MTISVTCNECPDRRSCRTLCESMKTLLSKESTPQREELRPQDELDQVPDDTSQAEENVADLSLMLLRSLSKRQREVLRLQYWEGLSMDQISSRLGISPRSSRIHAERGLAGLREKFISLQFRDVTNLGDEDLSQFLPPLYREANFSRPTLLGFEYESDQRPDFVDADGSPVEMWSAHKELAG